MRIIGGELSGRRIEAPRGDATRPTADRVREAVFNRLEHGAFEVPRVPLSGEVLDLYAGSGALGLEALSRGAARCDFVESSATAAATIRRNLAALGLQNRGAVHVLPVEAYLKRAGSLPHSLVFADPPYADAGLPLARTLARLGHGLSPGTLIVVEHGDHAVPEAPAEVQPLDQRRYGQTVISFFASRGRGIAEPP